MSVTDGASGGLVSEEVGPMTQQLSSQPLPCYSYKMNYPRRGTAMIINNERFTNNLPQRTGSSLDADRLYSLFNLLKFEKIIQLDDLRVEEMKNELTKIAQADHSNSSCFVCAILTHGEEGYLYGTDDKLNVGDLLAPFKGNRCKSLAGKPKIFILQACRGDDLDDGVSTGDSGFDASDAGVFDTPMQEFEEDIDERKIPVEADFLLAYSVVPGYYSWRNPDTGSFFISAIDEVFRENWRKLDLLTMFTRVNYKVAHDFESLTRDANRLKKKQMPSITSMLTKDVFF
ncbi:caspase-3-like [Physella acuta]|uniref:caspase-3-like n=1 Tax=Physella acuta TaxID=109671 RepID=UPI0027DD55BA|nr:caspase-3-like [Physella acuta]